MTRSDHADNITMSGGGLYSLATIGAKDVIDKATPQLLKALKQIGKAPLNYWSFSDMGCADGGTSLSLWRSVVEQLRVDDNSDVQIVYADQAGNDFNALVQILHGHTDFDAYLPDFENVRILESGSSFYTPVLPAQSLHLGFSATAMHWLSQKPGDISDHIHMVGASGAERAVFASQAAKDWQTILLHRARELVVGGKLVLVNFCIDENGRYLGNTDGINMFDQFNQLWQTWVDDGVITDREYRSMTLPQYYNSVDEFLQPLQDETSPVHKAGLRLVDIHTDIVKCPFARDYATHQDADKFAKAYIPTIRSWNESIFAGALDTGRPLEERQALIRDYYQRYENLVAESPDGHAMDYVHAYMTLEKVQP